MKEFLFLYGSLLPGAAPPEIAHAVTHLRFVGEASLPGTLFDLGEFPGAVLEPGAAGRIFGCVFELPADPAILRAIDEYEEFDSGTPEKSLFTRRHAFASLAVGGVQACWVYVFNGDAKQAPRIAAGRWRRER